VYVTTGFTSAVLVIFPHFSYTIPVFIPPARNSYICTICKRTEYDDGEMRAGMAKKVVPEQQLPQAPYRNQQLFSDYRKSARKLPSFMREMNGASPPR